MNDCSPAFEKKFDSQIYHVEFSPFEWSHDILCIAFAKKICIAQVRFEDGMDFKVIGEYNHDVQCYNIAISSLTSLNVLPKILQFCTAGADHKVRIYNSDLLEDNTCQILDGHTDYINDMAFEAENNYLATGGDDLTARVWDVREGGCACVCVWWLGAAAVSVCWHPNDHGKLMVCEKGGVVRFYNVHTQQPIMSLEGGAPVCSAHWGSADAQLLAALQQGELMLWDLTRPSRPAHSKSVHAHGAAAGYLRLCPAGQHAATLDLLALRVRVTRLQNGHTVLSAPVLLPTRLTWHLHLPLLAVADDRTICFYSIPSN